MILERTDDNSLSTMNMQMVVHAGAKDADYIIYNSTIFHGELTDISQMLENSSCLPILRQLRTEMSGAPTQNLFQETMELGTMIEDIHTMLTSDDPNLDTLTYMHKLK